MIRSHKSSPSVDSYSQQQTKSPDPFRSPETAFDADVKAPPRTTSLSQARQRAFSLSAALSLETKTELPKITPFRNHPTHSPDSYDFDLNSIHSSSPISPRPRSPTHRKKGPRTGMLFTELPSSLYHTSPKSSKEMSPLNEHSPTSIQNDQSISEHTNDQPNDDGSLVRSDSSKTAPDLYCYSPTCTKDERCYSNTCPYKNIRAKVSAPDLNRDYSSSSQFTQLTSLSKSSSTSDKPVRSPSDSSNRDFSQKDRLWSNYAPTELVQSVSKKELKRQEIIFELIYTEHDFVSDLIHLKDIFIKGLSRSDIIEESRRSDFIEEVFSNVEEIIEVNSRLSQALQERQMQDYVVDHIGDVFLSHVSEFEPFITYGIQQVFSKYYLDMELKKNPLFLQFIKDCERLPESRKLTIQSFLGRPTTRLARYPLLLEQVLKNTMEDNPDQETIPKVLEVIRKYLRFINTESGKADNRLRLRLIYDQMSCKPHELKELDILNESRVLLREGVLKKRSGVEHMEVHIFLFDHALVLTKRRKIKETDQYEYKMVKKPIPLELLSLSTPEDPETWTHSLRRTSLSHPTHSKANSFNYRQLPVEAALARVGYAFTITHLGRKGGTYTLVAPNVADRQAWVEKLEKQREAVLEKNRIFELVPLTSLTFPIQHKVNTSAVFDLGRKIAIGTDDGIYVGFDGDAKSFYKIIEMEKISQLDILEDYNLLLVLADRTLYSFSLDVLDTMDHPALKHAKELSSNVSFFKVGTCIEKTLLCVVKSTSLSTTIKVFEPIPLSGHRKKQSMARFLLRRGFDEMKVFRKLFIPSPSSSIHFLRFQLCVGCSKGFEVVDLKTLNTQGLLDPSDETLSFITGRENIMPISIFRTPSGLFLLCFDELAFYVDRNGRRARDHWIVYWEGEPNAFAYSYPFIIAFNDNFIEIRHIESGQLEQIIAMGAIKTINTNPSSIHCVSTGGAVGDYQHVYKVQFRAEYVENI